MLRINLTTASGVERVPLISVTSLEISEANVENIDIAVHDLPPTSRVDGLLGLNFLKNFEVKCTLTLSKVSCNYDIEL